MDVGVLSLVAALAAVLAGSALRDRQHNARVDRLLTELRHANNLAVTRTTSELVAVERAQAAADKASPLQADQVDETRRRAGR
jgi:hypothetical protein